MHRRWIGIGWTLALLALLGHVAGADCCLIRGAVRETLARAAAAAPAPGPHACCTGTAAGAATAPANTADGDAPLPDCCGVNCAPTATLQAWFALEAPASAPLASSPERIEAPEAWSNSVRAPAPDLTRSPPEPAPRVMRGRAPPIA